MQGDDPIGKGWYDGNRKLAMFTSCKETAPKLQDVPAASKPQNLHADL